MTSSKTLAQPGRPSAASVRESNPSSLPGPSDTLVARGSSSDATLAGTTAEWGLAAAERVAPRSAPARTMVTVLPEVREEAERLVLVPRDESRYEHEKLLGRGGMGQVELARDQDIGRQVAVKKLLEPANPHAVARFVDEVRTVGRLEHPNIVPIHDVGVDEAGALYFVMKYVDGETLSDVIAALARGDRQVHARYTFEHRLDVFVSLLRALQYAHAQGLVHRDIKPENIMIGRYGEVVLMDWGIARQIRGEERPTALGAAARERAVGETVDGAIIGTPRYMSPEQARGENSRLDQRSDLYSAFVVLYELLTLRPYIEEGKTAMATVLAVTERQIPTIGDPAWEHPHQDPVPAEYRHFLRHGLAPNPGDRYAEAADVVAELGRIRSGDFKVECPITFMKHNNTVMGRFMDRRPTASLLLAAATLVIFLGGVAGWVAFLAP